VTGASRLGDQLAGVVVAQSSGKLSLWAENGAEGTVLILEGLLATGTQLVMTAERAREAGATGLVAAAVLADPSVLESAEQELGGALIALYSV
jgi:hypothetical protein